MASLFNISHLKERYGAMMSDRSVNLHATLAEMLGTGILVLIGTSAVQLAADAAAAAGVVDTVARNNTFMFTAVVFGLTYFAVMCATRHHGGAHLNPAITIACMLSGVCGFVQAVVFIIVQVLGAIIGSAIVLGLTPDDARDDSLLGANVYVATPGLTKDRAFGAEIIGTFVLTYIYLQTYSHPRSEHGMLAPLAVGLSYVALLTAAGPLSSASLNPARSLGPASVAAEGDDLWIWTIGPLVGALIAVPLHLISVTDLPAFDKDGHMIKKSSSAVDIADTNVKTAAEAAV